MTDSPPTDQTDDDRLPIDIDEGTQVLYNQDGNQQIGMVSAESAPGRGYFRLMSGIPLHESDVIGVVVYADEADFTFPE